MTQLSEIHFIADNGKVFRRISDGTICGKEISLGILYYLNGEKIENPRMDRIDDFEEIVDEQYNEIAKLNNEEF